MPCFFAARRAKGDTCAASACSDCADGATSLTFGLSKLEASTTPVESASAPSAGLAAGAGAASSLPALSVEDESEVSESGVTSPWGAESFAAPPLPLVLSPLPLVLSPSPSFVVEPSLALWTPASSCWSCCSCSTTSAMAETGIVCMIITAEAMVTRAILAAKAAFRRVLRKQRRWASPSRRPPRSLGKFGVPVFSVCVLEHDDSPEHVRPAAAVCRGAQPRRCFMQVQSRVSSPLVPIDAAVRLPMRLRVVYASSAPTKQSRQINAARQYINCNFHCTSRHNNAKFDWIIRLV